MMEGICGPGGGGRELLDREVNLSVTCSVLGVITGEPIPIGTIGGGGKRLMAAGGGGTELGGKSGGGRGSKSDRRSVIVTGSYTR